MWALGIKYVALPICLMAFHLLVTTWQTYRLPRGPSAAQLRPLPPVLGLELAISNLFMSVFVFLDYDNLAAISPVIGGHLPLALALVSYIVVALLVFVSVLWVYEKKVVAKESRWRTKGLKALRDQLFAKRIGPPAKEAKERPQCDRCSLCILLQWVERFIASAAKRVGTARALLEKRAMFWRAVVAVLGALPTTLGVLVLFNG